MRRQILREMLAALLAGLLLAIALVAAGAGWTMAAAESAFVPLDVTLDCGHEQAAQLPLPPGGAEGGSPARNSVKEFAMGYFGLRERSLTARAPCSRFWKSALEAASMTEEGTMQTITTPNGETLVVLGLEEYECLVDQANIAGGRDELIPADVVNRILDGENPIKVWRSYRGLTARELATATGLSAPYISEIESGKKEGSVSAVKKIAEALKVDMDDLV